MKRLLAALLVAAVGLPALAYVLPTPALLDFLGQRKDGLHAATLKVDGSLTLLDADGGRRVVPASHLVRFDQQCRLELEVSDDDALAGVYTAYDRGKLTPPTDASVADLGTLEQLACPLVSARTHATAEVGRLLRTLHVDTGETTLARQDGRPAYVIGAKPWETDRPQLWLDHKTFLPVRIVAKIGGHVAEVRLLKYDDPATGEWHPGKLQLYLDGTLRLEFAAEHLDQNVKLTDSRFR